MLIVTSTSAKRSFSESGFVDGQRLLARTRSWNYESKAWDKTWTNHVLRLDDPAKKDDHIISSVDFSIDLDMGGTIHIQCNAISVEQSEQLKKEMLHNVIKRRYPVQNRFEPRVHSLYHANATTVGVEHDDCTPQPSYSYGSARMKAFRLSNVPRIQALCYLMAVFCKAKYGCEFDELPLEEKKNFWNVGVDPILYRDGGDKIGFHADNDQGEEYIVTLVVDCPAGPRRIIVQPNKKIMKKLRRGKLPGEPPVEQIELFLGSRDLYTMDKAMQQNYVHGVPVDKKQAGVGKQRLALVFRRGKEQYSKVDSGVTVNNLTPAEKKANYLYGPVLKSRDYSSADPDRVKPRMMEEITEARWTDPNETNVIQYGDIVRRIVMLDWHMHSAVQGGVSGNQAFGCDSIVISQPRGKREVSQVFIYKAKNKQGGLALADSFHRQQAVRTWRSNRHDSTIRLCNVKRKTKSQDYRYDGLAEIINYRRPLKAGEDFVFLMCMMNWDGEKNNDQPDMEEYDRVRLLRRTPDSNKALDEVHDLARLVAELEADPSVRSYRRAESSEAVDDDDAHADDELDVSDDDEDILHETMQEEEDTVLQGTIQDAGVLTIATTTSRKRRVNGSRNGPAKTKAKRSVVAKEKMLKEAIADAKIEFNKKRDRIMSRLPPNYGIGDIGVVKYRNKNHVVLVCHPFHVPPSPVREDWLRLHFKKVQQGKKTAYAIVYWYGQTNEKSMYGYTPLSGIKPYDGREKGLVLNKRGKAELEEDLMKNPTDRRRGLETFLEGYETLGRDDVEEAMEECGED